jgi:hypothetical protein
MSNKIPQEELKQNSIKILYMGFPMKLYEQSNPPIIWGFWSFIPVIFPIYDQELGFEFKPYRGSYLKALWCWLNHTE